VPITVINIGIAPIPNHNFYVWRARTLYKEIKWMKANIVILFAFALTGLYSCGSSMQVFSDYDKDADMSAYKTYSWLTEEQIESKGTNPLYYNELNDKRIKQAVYEQMKRRGFTYSNETQPLEMHYHIIVEDKTLVTTEPGGYGYGPVFESKRKQAYPYRQGTLIIDLMDTKNKTLVWRGGATSAIESEISKNPEEAIRKGVEKIFEKFPYRY
jgi:hypothetical protein